MSKPRKDYYPKLYDRLQNLPSLAWRCRDGVVNCIRSHAKRAHKSTHTIADPITRKIIA